MALRRKIKKVKPPHRGTFIKFDNFNIKIDKKLCGLINNLWELGIRTVSSCEGSCGFLCKHKWKQKRNKKESYSYHTVTKQCYTYVWLVFEQIKDYEKFLNIVCDYNDPIYNNILERAEKKYQKDNWSIRVLHENYGVKYRTNKAKDLWIEDGCVKNNIIMKLQLTFPQKHLSYVEKRIAHAFKIKQ